MHSWDASHVEIRVIERDTTTPAAAENPAEVTAELESLRAELDATRTDLDAAYEERDRFLELAQRAQADLENLRRRLTRDVANAEKRGLQRAVGEIVGAADSLDHALATLPADPDESEHPLASGLRAVHGQFHAALGRLNVVAFDPAGGVFDPTEMEALATRPAGEDTPAGTVVEVYQQGFRIGEHVLRPARVVVAA